MPLVSRYSPTSATYSGSTWKITSSGSEDWPAGPASGLAGLLMDSDSSASRFRLESRLGYVGGSLVMGGRPISSWLSPGWAKMRSGAGPGGSWGTTAAGWPGSLAANSMPAVNARAARTTTVDNASQRLRGDKILHVPILLHARVARNLRDVVYTFRNRGWRFPRRQGL